MTGRAGRATAYAAAVAIVLSVLAPAGAGADAEPSPGLQRAGLSCHPSGHTVAKTRLRTRSGKRLGKARITRETVDGDTTVCGVLTIRRPFRKRTTTVTVNLRERSQDGHSLGQAKSVRPATRVRPVAMRSSFVPHGSTFILRTKVDPRGKLRARAKLRHTVS